MTKPDIEALSKEFCEMTKDEHIEALTKENMRLMGLLSGAASLRKDAE